MHIVSPETALTPSQTATTRGASLLDFLLGQTSRQRGRQLVSLLLISDLQSVQELAQRVSTGHWEADGGGGRAYSGATDLELGVSLALLDLHILGILAKTTNVKQCRTVAGKRGLPARSGEELLHVSDLLRLIN